MMTLTEQISEIFRAGDARALSHASGLPECAACGGEILDEEAERSILYVDEDGNQARIVVGDCCALALLADILERKPGGLAEAEAFRVLREIAAEHESGVWKRG